MRPIMLFTAAIICISSASVVIAQPQPEIPPNTISCDGFKKMPNGEWFALPNNPPFDLGAAHQITIASSNVPPRGYRLGGYDLYTVLEAKCGTQPK
jgi:hypothetical protein